MASTPDLVRGVLSATPSLELLAPASAADVSAFEERFGITLPGDYRRFLVEVADGIACDGELWLYTLADVADQLARDGATAARPFWYSAADADALRRAVRAGGEAGSVFTAEVMAMQKPGSPDGCLTLASNGGNDFSVLVVTGEQRGAMWRTGELDTPEVRELYTPGIVDDQTLDFASWFPLWATCFLGVEWPASGRPPASPAAGYLRLFGTP